MHILIAPDKFKGSLEAEEVSYAIREGIRKFDPSIKTTLLPMADGGEGSLSIISNYKDVENIPLKVKGPLGRTIESYYMLSQEDAYIEMARASGLMLLEPDERNPLYTTSFGTGELMMDAILLGAKNIYLFVGGSATNDMGIGMAQVLGYEFWDKDDELVPPVGVSLPFITRLSLNLNFNQDEINFYAVCDVENELYGDNGAAYVYAGQKGANQEEIEILDKGLRSLSKRCKQFLNKDVSTIPGSGAAGGVGAGVLAFLDGKILPGTEFMMNLSNFEHHLKTADLVITGEGKMDRQTLEGKVISGVAKKAKKSNVPVWTISGISHLSDPDLDSIGITESSTIMDKAKDLNKAMINATEYIEQIVFEMLKEKL